MYRAFLVDTFLNAAYLYDDDRLVLVLNYSGENSKVTLNIVEKATNGAGSTCSAFAPSGAPDGSNLNTPNVVIFFFQKVAAIVVRFSR
jgi:hypothetical protein